MRTILLTVAVTLLVLALGGFLFVYSGAYNVAASGGHTALEAWVLETAMERSVRARAGEDPVPDLADSARVSAGFRAYREMCATCHGAPGVERSVTGRGLEPMPPRLSRAAEAWSPNELFWILQHGVKMSGMPAYGRTHSEAELWELVAFVAALPDISDEEYGAMEARLDTLMEHAATDSATAVPAGHEGHDHTH